MAAIHTSLEVVKYGQGSRRRDLEDVAETVSAALFGRSVEIAVNSESQATDGSAAVNGVEVVENSVRAGGSDPENETCVVCAAAGDGSVQVAIAALRHQEGILWATTASGEVKQIGIGLRVKGWCK